MGMCVFGAFRRQKPAFPKVQNPKMGLPITPRPFSSDPLPFRDITLPFFAIFGRPSGQIFKKIVVFLFVVCNIWPLARPNIAKMGGGRLKMGGGRFKMGEG